MLKCIIMSEAIADDTGNKTLLVGSQLKGIGDKFYLTYAENGQDAPENHIIIQHGVMAFRVLCIASCATAFLWYIRNY